MKLTSTLLVGSLLASAATLSSFGLVNDGSNASRAPLPSQRSADYVTVTNSKAVQTVQIANHLGRPDSTQLISVMTPVQIGTPILTISPVKIDATNVVASAK